MYFDRSQIQLRANLWRTLWTVTLVMGLLTVSFLVQRYLRVTFRDLNFDWLLEIRRNSFILMSLVLFTPLVHYLKRRFPLSRLELSRNFIWHIVFAILFGTAHLIFVSSINGSPNFIKVSSKIFLNFFHLEVLSYWLILGAFYIGDGSRNQESVAVVGGSSIPVNVKGIVINVPCEQIIKIQAFDHYLKISTASDIYTIRSSITEMEKKLRSQRFLRIHRSWIVNTTSVDGFGSGGQPTILLSDGSQLSIGRTYLKPVKKYFKEDFTT